ncbi:MAG: phosphoribosylformylglycinamidine synthase subunit PurQ [Bacteroidetes bacterium]|nr:phosphoribosylformylglycinamidine synthase subunit PurQ [Bacteroidota bacterium]MBK9672527.1 phosphoribosylformylglycinamidine synthase subunit PurQ [Bacteroidota bacterium]MBK9799817.1 phosphoribosylformylglycinamidine synthase subunit PurQ [Bacteroidota bacterium]MBP6412916.1 phosphoribosylformylglycinamidine synthase subunit PurQ [Bacteroidia bacterium]
MKFGVVVFPGSNCDQDMVYVLQSIMKQRVVQLWHKDSDLQGCDFIVLPGGFSFGDYLRSGAIARFSPIMEKVIEFANAGGNVLGICNGFQILCEAGLLPGALLHNTSQKFISKNTYIKSQTSNSRVTAAINKNKALCIPIAHGEGRYFTDAETLKKLNNQDQILFRYCDQHGAINDAANPNGSLENIAGICNHQRNVFGMMPHPERAADKELRNVDGKLIFDSILSLVKSY